MKYIMALDQGTTSSRCILFDENGNLVEKHSIEFRQIYGSSCRQNAYAFCDVPVC